MVAKVIANPAAQGGIFKKQWPRIQAWLKQEQFPCEVVWTQARGHATALAREALQAGFTLLIAAGGDGTLHEVVNGMLQQGRSINPEASLGIIACGTGADFARTLNVPSQVETAMQYLARQAHPRRVDVGEVKFLVAGQATQRYFINIAGMGFDAEVVEYLERHGKQGCRRWSYLRALFKTVLRYHSKTLSYQVDGNRRKDCLNSLIVCNGRYFGGGFYMSPHSQIDDGQLEVIAIKDLHPLKILWHTPKLYRGTYLKLRQVSSTQGRTVVVEPAQRMCIQADGEFIGEGTASFHIHPRALQLYY